MHGITVVIGFVVTIWNKAKCGYFAQNRVFVLRQIGSQKVAITTPRTWLNLKDSYLYNIGQSVFKFAYCDKLAKMDELTKRLNNTNFDGYVTDL